MSWLPWKKRINKRLVVGRGVASTMVFWSNLYTLPENYYMLQLKMDGWKTIGRSFSFWVSAYFQGRTVGFREGTFFLLRVCPLDRLDKLNCLCWLLEHSKESNSQQINYHQQIADRRSESNDIWIVSFYLYLYQYPCPGCQGSAEVLTAAFAIPSTSCVAGVLQAATLEVPTPRAWWPSSLSVKDPEMEISNNGQLDELNLNQMKSMKSEVFFRQILLNASLFLFLVVVYCWFKDPVASVICIQSLDAAGWKKNMRCLPWILGCLHGETMW